MKKKILCMHTICAIIFCVATQKLHKWQSINELLPTCNGNLKVIYISRTNILKSTITPCIEMTMQKRRKKSTNSQDTIVKFTQSLYHKMHDMRLHFLFDCCDKITTHINAQFFPPRLWFILFAFFLMCSTASQIEFSNQVKSNHTHFHHLKNCTFYNNYSLLKAFY